VTRSRIWRGSELSGAEPGRHPRRPCLRLLGHGLQPDRLQSRGYCIRAFGDTSLPHPAPSRVHQEGQVIRRYVPKCTVSDGSLPGVLRVSRGSTPVVTPSSARRYRPDVEVGGYVHGAAPSHASANAWAFAASFRSTSPA
jgi:hypothetical protein